MELSHIHTWVHRISHLQSSTWELSVQHEQPSLYQTMHFKYNGEARLLIGALDDRLKWTPPLVIYLG